jgi:hypothetical protein
MCGRQGLLSHCNTAQHSTATMSSPVTRSVLVSPICIYAGKAGSTSVDLSVLDPSGLVAWQCLSQSTAAAAAGPGSGSLLLMCSPSKQHWRSIQTHIDNAVHGVMQVGQDGTSPPPRKAAGMDPQTSVLLQL